MIFPKEASREKSQTEEKNEKSLKKREKMNKENREEIENCKKEVEVLKKIVDEMLKTKSLERVDKLFDSAVKKLDRIYFLSLKNLLDKKF